MPLKITVRDGELLFVNGAILEFYRRTKIGFHTKANFLKGADFLLPEDAHTALEKLYLELQYVYAGSPEERIAAAGRVPKAAKAAIEESPTRERRKLVSKVRATFDREQHHLALKCLRLAIFENDARALQWLAQELE
jgi:flagellar biosynthesis regulator FlbT